jgi:flavin reductase (DIM6/NTAB) family NADH-FMN oxidoreductase RutF
MKRIFLISCLLTVLITVSSNLFAQVDSKYLAGAVPEVNGKVIFSDTLQLQDLDKNQIYEFVLIWAKANYNTEDSRVAYTNEEESIVSCRGRSELRFSSSALSLDRAFMIYQLNIFCLENACRIEMRSINYEYNVASKREPEKYFAEKWITDKEALNGKNKLYRSNGKFRIKTVDLFDDICNSLNINIQTGEVDLYTDKDKSNLYNRKKPKEIAAKTAVQSQEEPVVIRQEPPQNTVIETQTIQQVPEPPRMPVVAPKTESLTTGTTLDGFRQLDPKQIPGNIIKMLTDDWMLITAGDDNKFNMMTASWGGLGSLYGKPVTFCFINPTRYTFQLMESGDTYTLSFYTEAHRDALRYSGSASGRDTDKIKGSGLTPITTPSGAKSFSEAWLIIECKKLVAQQLQWESVRNETIRDEWSKSQFHKMYIGEILTVWVK